MLSTYNKLLRKLNVEIISEFKWLNKTPNHIFEKTITAKILYKNKIIDIIFNFKKILITYDNYRLHIYKRAFDLSIKINKFVLYIAYNDNYTIKSATPTLPIFPIFIQPLCNDLKKLFLIN